MPQEGSDIEIKILSENPVVSQPKQAEVIKITEEELKTNPQIVITENDIEATKITPPDIVIHNRDVARNPLEWLAGATKDVAEYVKSLTKDTRWWGGGEKGKQRIVEYQRVEKERADVEAIFNRIVILPSQTWRDVTDHDLGEIEIKLIEEATKPHEGEEIVITEEDLSKPQPTETPTEQAERVKKYWETYTREQRELFDVQERAINGLYAERRLNTPIVMERHHRQEHVGQDGIWSCAVASSLNALYALQEARPGETEDGIIQAIGGRTAFSENGYLPMGRTYDFLRERGLLIRDSGNMMELIQTLENGGVAVIAYGGHARLISGAETQDGQVFIRVNDPLSSVVSRIPVKELMMKINQTRNFYNMFLIEKPPQINITEQH